MSPPCLLQTGGYSCWNVTMFVRARRTVFERFGSVRPSTDTWSGSPGGRPPGIPSSAPSRRWSSSITSHSLAAQPRGKSSLRTWRPSWNSGCRDAVHGAERRRTEPASTPTDGYPLSSCFGCWFRTSWERNAACACPSRPRHPSSSAICTKSAGCDRRRCIVTGTTSGPLRRILNGSAVPTSPSSRQR